MARKAKTISAEQRGAPTIDDVAARAGVSKMTVSRALGASGYIQAETRARVMLAIKELNYTPNRSARQLAGASQLRFGLLYHRPRSSYIMDLMFGAMEAASTIDVQLVSRACDIDGDALDVLGSLIEAGADALMLTAPLCDVPELVALATDATIPTVLVSTSSALPGASTISIDDHAAAREMTRHLLALGHRRIGFICGTPALAASRLRQDGFTSAIAEAGIGIDPSLIAPGEFIYESGAQAARQLLAHPERPSAIFASNDDMAAATIAVAHQLGLRVPQELSVCGFDDSWIATATRPALTTVHQPVQDMARQAVLMMLDDVARARRDSGRIVASHRIVDFSLVRRQSDIPPAGGEPLA